MKGFLPKRNTPRWIIFMIDLGICLFSLTLAFGLRFNFNIPEDAFQKHLLASLPYFLMVRVLSFVVGRTYAGIVRYTSTEDAQRIFTTVSAGSLLLVGLNFLRYYFVETYFLPFSILVIDYLATVFLMISYRIAIKLFYLELRSPKKDRSDVIIYGAGELGMITKRTLDRDISTSYKIKCFLDDDPKKSGKKLEGTPIHHSSKLKDLLANESVDELVIAIKNPKEEHKRKVIDQCLEFDINVLTIPSIDNWIDGELSIKQIKQVKIEDLLGRDPIELDRTTISSRFQDKRILVTGAAGSIGSEIVRQLAPYGPSELILLDQAESPLYDLDMELKASYNDLSYQLVIADITNQPRMEKIFRDFQPEVVFHAAAYKHVPLMETNIEEAMMTNVFGSRILVDLSVAHGIDEFVLISTDKAVNPTSVMGASKRLAEIYAQSSNQKDGTKFITTRFGNVLGSNGSVIPLFKKQIEKGGPLTVTHPEVTRYFMTIPEASQLVLEAAAMGEGGEVFLFDMGRSVKIIDLARKMIKLSGLEPGNDIKIKITGLRPGEKLYEELLNDQEKTLPTHHPQILIGKVREYEKEKIQEKLQTLRELMESQKEQAVIKKMKEVIPEYQNGNSASLEEQSKNLDS